jgi:signal transduction histidine kinase
VLILLASVLVAARWCGHAAGYAATLAAAAFSVALLALADRTSSGGADAAALVLLGLIGGGIAAWTGQRSAARPPTADPGRLKEEFLATVSHELRTPLNAILGWTELLRMRRREPSPHVDRGLEVIERNARRQLALVEELLAAAEPETSPAQWQPLDARQLLDGVICGLEPAATKAQVRFILDAPEGAALPPTGEAIWIRGDAASLRLALRHVLDNAIKYSAEGGEVRMRLRQCGRQVLIFVADTGRGIDAGRVDDVFEPFSQADSSAARPFGGLGLGLTIARRLIERHHGHVDLQGNEGSRGATVLITLPAASGD